MQALKGGLVVQDLNYTHEELIRLFDAASPSTQRMVFSILKIDQESNETVRTYERYLGQPKSTINGIPLYEMASPRTED